ncbi:MAG TPA: 2Fe-2S iron-sulfur cluster-binding protein [Steroidobacteraceae bacterium]|nr:2Fe-2S iron-sulfur cluster-binding protein [Steroidobacteraceae bacterium]
MKSPDGPHRLPRGGLVDRTRVIPFQFNGKRFEGFAGDSVASALLANGVRVVGRSFKFHRPRGLLSAGVEEPNGLLTVGDGAARTASVRAPVQMLVPELDVHSQAGWPSVDFDVGRALDFTASLWQAGFYNKTFMWPGWHTYEPAIRRMAGLGRAPDGPDPDRYEVRNMHCDVLVIGGGAAGLREAIDAARTGARVVLAETDFQFGGETIWNGSGVDGEPGNDWLSRALTGLAAMTDVRLLPGSTAVGIYDDRVTVLVERVAEASGVSGAPHRRRAPRERYWIVRAERVVLATGAIEQPLIFENNDRPGIMLAGAARQYLRRFGVAIGSRVLIATNNDSAYALAKDLKEAGVLVLGIADSRHPVPIEPSTAAASLGIELFPGSIPIGTTGFSRLETVRLGRLNADASGIVSSRAGARLVVCDALAVSGGFTPALQLYAHAGGALAYDPPSGALLPVHPVPGVTAAGGAAQSIPAGPRVSPSGRPGRQWVDLLHDVTVADLELALRENFTSMEHLKRYTTVGMAADQGKTSTVATLDVVARLRGISPSQLKHTTMRPPFVPVTLGAIAGRELGERFAPRRELPMSAWHAAHGALFHDYGEWRRPTVYLEPGETREGAVRREARAVRGEAGLFDGSPLGKLEIHGPDALEFLDRFYINDLTTLKPMRARYGLMLRESGVIFDDGTVTMLAPDHLNVTTTSGGAGNVLRWLEEWRQCEWPDLRVAIMPVTEQWATIALAGPKARTVLSRLETDIDLSATAFPHLGLRMGHLLGFPARIFRVSFTGELTYEINVPARAGQAVWEALLSAGASDGVQPLGLDALLMLRLEKGFLHIGTDTDGTTIPDDVGWGKTAANKRRDFVGKRSLLLPENTRTDRHQLVGLAITDGAAFVIGSHLRVPGSAHASDGWITSACTTVLTNQPVGLAMVRGGRTRVGQEVEVYDLGARVARARIVNPPFIDPAGERMNG